MKHINTFVKTITIVHKILFYFIFPLSTRSRSRDWRPWELQVGSSATCSCRSSNQLWGKELIQTVLVKSVSLFFKSHFINSLRLFPSVSLTNVFLQLVLSTDLRLSLIIKLRGGERWSQIIVVVYFTHWGKHCVRLFKINRKNFFLDLVWS